MAASISIGVLFLGVLVKGALIFGVCSRAPDVWICGSILGPLMFGYVGSTLEPLIVENSRITSDRFWLFGSGQLVLG